MYMMMRRFPGSKSILDDNPGKLHNDPLVFDILTSTRKKLASNEKDKVIALYGLFVELKIPFPAPDYTLPVEDIYRQATAASIKYDRSLHILYHAPSDKRRKDLASWVPDWAEQGFDPGDGRHAILHDRFAASGPGHTRFHFSDDEKVLILRGKIIDTIMFKADPLPDAIPVALRLRGRESQEQMRDMYLQHNHAATSILRGWVKVSKWADYPTGEPTKDALQRTLVQDNPEENGRYTADGSFDTWYDNMSLTDIKLAAKSMQRLHLEAHQRRDTNSDLQTSSALFATNPFHVFTTLACSQKCFFYTENNYFGTAPDPLPDSMQAGDVVALVSGLEMPLVLRRVEGGLRLISHVYVHGVMYGELWPEDGELEDIALV